MPKNVKWNGGVDKAQFEKAAEDLLNIYFQATRLVRIIHLSQPKLEAMPRYWRRRHRSRRGIDGLDPEQKSIVRSSSLLQYFARHRALSRRGNTVRAVPWSTSCLERDRGWILRQSFKHAIKLNHIRIWEILDFPREKGSELASTPSSHNWSWCWFVNLVVVLSFVFVIQFVPSVYTCLHCKHWLNIWPWIHPSRCREILHLVVPLFEARRTLDTLLSTAVTIKSPVTSKRKNICSFLTDNYSFWSLKISWNGA